MGCLRAANVHFGAANWGLFKPIVLLVYVQIGPHRGAENVEKGNLGSKRATLGQPSWGGVGLFKPIVLLVYVQIGLHRGAEN